MLFSLYQMTVINLSGLVKNELNYQLNINGEL